MPEVEMPWDKDGEEFSEERARKWVTDLSGDKKKLQDRNSALKKELDSLKGSGGDLQAENLRLRVQMQTGLNDSQMRRLVGNTEEELLEDAQNFAGETGIELRSFFGDPNAGDPGEDQGGSNGEEPSAQGTQERSLGQHFRTPQGGQGPDSFAQDPPMEDLIARMEF